ncbi:zinc-ribbon and DUF3426 domain-containing protein [Variovorax ureilyticus]|uniref:zinc-ribbon and DUF3426 domain-containing protein n=1 Tax=Variovorax ureilyticus TaxID=1836198 RepID=UPI003D66ECE1
MSLVTRCPACATPFKVVRDQLRISDGWVRCGRCSQVFDATVDLHDAAEFSVESPDVPPSPVAEPVAEEHPHEDVAPHEPAAVDEPPPSALPQSHADSVESADVETDFFDDFHDAPSDHPAAPSGEPVRAPGAAHDEEGAHADSPVGGIVPDVAWPDADMLSLGDEGRVAVRPPEPPPLSFPDIDLSLTSPPAASVPVAAAAATDAEPEPEPEPASEDASQVQLQKALRRARVKSAKIARANKARERKAAQADTAPVVLAASEFEPATLPMAAEIPPFLGAEPANGFWQRSAVRRSMALLAVLGVVLLLAQMAYQERDLIVARQPSLRPAMTSMCRVFGCEISALRQINDIKVDGASFAREKNDDGYRFSFTLRNGADVPLAMPAVELSLLDTQERAVVRRVLMPAEFGAPNVLPARSERSASLSLRLTGPEAARMPPVAGFRVETLYP